MSHTEGKLSQDRYGNIKTESDDDFRLNGATLSSKDLAMANTRRLVACWNEHDGLVHDNAQLYQSLQAEMRARLDVEKERDELVNVLNACRFALEPYDDVKPRDWKTDRERLASAHRAVSAILARYPEGKS